MNHLNPPTKKRSGRAWGGLALTLIGSAGLVGLQLLVYAHTPAAERLQVVLGLAGATLASALFQVILLVGVALLWSALRRSAGERSPDEPS
jgi:hypothetical protein